MCIVGLAYRLIVVCEHDLICVYVCTNEIDVPSTNSIPAWGQYILWLWLYVKYLHDGINISNSHGYNGNPQHWNNHATLQK